MFSTALCRQKIKEELSHGNANENERIESSQAMSVIMARKKQKRSLANQSFNGIVLEYSEPNYDAKTPADYKEIIDFFTKLKNQCASPTPIRYQIVYRANAQSDFHWSAMDIEIKNGLLSVFMLNSNNKEINLNITDVIRNQFPEASIICWGDYVQKDFDNCAIFAYDMVCRTAKIDNLHAIIKTHHKPNCYDDINHNILFLQTSNLPRKLGPLLRNMQSFNLFNQFLKSSYIGNDQKNLPDYIAERITFVSRMQKVKEEMLPIKHKVNFAIIFKRTDVKRKTQQFLNTLDDPSLEVILKR